MQGCYALVSQHKYGDIRTEPLNDSYFSDWDSKPNEMD